MEAAGEPRSFHTCPFVTPNDVDLRQDEAFNARLAKKFSQCIDCMQPTAAPVTADDEEITSTQLMKLYYIYARLPMDFERANHCKIYA
jgi:hypothetical protein